MDESWNFIKEAPENELALVREACNKCGLQISSSASSEQLVSSILMQYDLNVEDGYEEFLDRLCDKNAISIDGLCVEDKALEVLKFFLAEGIERMSDGQVERFASNYCFSNLTKEKLIQESEVRLKTSNRFRAKLFHIVPALFGIDFTKIFPSDVSSSDIIELILKNCDIGVKYAPITSVLISIRNEHDHSDYTYISGYIGKIIQNDNYFDDRRNALSVMLFVVMKMKLEICVHNPVIEDISSYVARKPLAVPEYILHKIDVKEILKLIMERLFPCAKNLEGCYKAMYGKRLRYLEDSQFTIAFFDYKFPYTVIPKKATSYFLMPDDEIEQKAAKVFLLGNGIENPSNLLKSEKELKELPFSWAVVSHKQNIEFNSSVSIIYTEDHLIDKWKGYFSSLREPRLMDFENTMDFLSLCADIQYYAIHSYFKDIVNQLDTNNCIEFKRLKCVVQKLVG